MESPQRKAQQLSLDGISSWQERVQAIQDGLAGKPHKRCLSVDLRWDHFGCALDLLVVAGMCLRIYPTCEYCYERMRRS